MSNDAEFMGGDSQLDDDALDALLNRYFDGSTSAAEIAQLEARLIADEAFADRVSQWCLMHRQIAELMTESALHEMMDRFVQGAPGPPRGVFAPTGRVVRDTNDGGSTDTGRRRSWRTGIAVAATLAAVATIAVLWRGSKLPSESGKFFVDVSQNNDTPVGAAIIATVTRAADAVWAPGATPRHPGDQLSVGDHVSMSSGMAKVTFECGAEVVLEGPCDFVIQSHMLGYLNSGRITADVPRRAFGFAILSPDVEFVDLGTSFGVDIAADGRTELHVFEGEVLCSPSAADDNGTPIHVLANRAVEFATGAGPNNIAIDAAPFSELRALRRRSAGDGAGRIPSEELALWLAADTAVATDDLGRVVSWQDIVYGDNVSAEDAVQADAAARPRLVEKAIGGRRAIRFDGNSDWLLTTPLETTDDQTVLIVGQFTPNAFDKERRWGGQILNYDGPPSRYLSNLLEPGVLQIGEPLLEEQFKPTLLSAQVFAGFIGRATVEVGRVDAKPVGADAPFVLAYTYDYGNRRAELRINGQLYGSARAYAPHGITSRKIIGRHAWMQNFFHGDLAELLIYNQAMSPEELQATTAYLAVKYGIEVDAAE
jgi:hypothetical protein